MEKNEGWNLEKSVKNQSSVCVVRSAANILHSVKGKLNNVVGYLKLLDR